MLLNIFTTLSELFSVKLKRGVFSGDKFFGTWFPADAGRVCEPLVLTMFSEDSSAEGDISGSDEAFDALIKGEYKDAFSRKCQNVIDRRFKETKELEKFKAKVLPLLETVCKKLNLENGDLDTLASALENLDFGEISLKNGVSEGVSLKNDGGLRESGAVLKGSGEGSKVSNAGAVGGSVGGKSGVSDLSVGGKTGATGESEALGAVGDLSGGSLAEGGLDGALFKSSMEGSNAADGANGASGDVVEPFWAVGEFDENGTDGNLAIDDNGGYSSNAENRSFRDVLNERRLAKAGEIYRSMISEAEEVSRIYPSFDLDAECAKPAFCALLGAGMSLKDSYEALHKDEIIGEVMEYTARAVSEALSRNIQYRGKRISESAMSHVSTPLGKRSVSEMSDDEIMEIVKKVGRGEKVIL